MNRSDEALQRLARRLGRALLAAGRTVATAESCTGGWIAKALTDVPGSSAWFGTGYVCYSNAAKEALLGVSPRMLEQFGAVSEPVVSVLAREAVKRARASVAVAVSGIAGPDGGSAVKPVGTVWFAFAIRVGRRIEIRTRCCRFRGDRQSVRRQAVAEALRGLLALSGSR